jgi:hypothetical protein
MLKKMIKFFNFKIIIIMMKVINILLLLLF